MVVSASMTMGSCTQRPPASPFIPLITLPLSESHSFQRITFATESGRTFGGVTLERGKRWRDRACRGKMRPAERDAEQIGLQLRDLTAADMQFARSRRVKMHPQRDAAQPCAVQADARVKMNIDDQGTRMTLIILCLRGSSQPSYSSSCAPFMPYASLSSSSSSSAPFSPAASLPSASFFLRN